MSQKIYKALGLMSGTSMDGIDAAIIETNGEEIFQFIGGKSVKYDDEFILSLRNLIHGNEDPTKLEEQITILHANTVKELLDELSIDPLNIDCIGFHGHTIDHRPEDGVTIQIGDGNLLARLTSIKTVYDFRSNDVKAGGQGAPLAPIYHKILTKNETNPIAIVNIGGVANVTWINGDEILAFDTGPGNALLDDWIQHKTKQNFDKDGHISLSGQVDLRLLSMLLDNDFFKSPAPKSLDRNHFNIDHNNIELSIENAAATFTEFTAKTIALSQNFFPKPAKKWLITGGGRKNKAIMIRLQSLLDQPVENIDDLGFDGDLIEAQAFALMAVRSILNLPISFPNTTGVKEPLCGGKIASAL